MIDGGGGDGKKLPKSGEREAFVRGGGRLNNICVSVRAVVNGEYQWQRGTRQRLGETWYYYFLCPPGTRGRRTLSVTEEEAKRGIGANGEEVKRI